MGDRGPVFSDPEMATLIKKHCIPLAVNEALYREEKDEESRFLRRQARAEANSNLVLVTAGGRWLGDCSYARGFQGRKSLEEALDRWNRLPEEERRPGAIAIGDRGERHHSVPARPPAGGLVLKTFARWLKPDAQGRLARPAQGELEHGDPVECDLFRDVLWLTEGEWKSLVPSNPRKGEEFPVARPILERVFRFYLYDYYRHTRMVWTRDEIRSAELRVKVEEATPDRLTLGLRGRAVMASESDLKKARKSYEGSLDGVLRYDLKKKVFTRFDVVAVGESRTDFSEGTTITGALPPKLTGPLKIGVAFELAPPGSGFDVAPPMWVQDGQYHGGGSGSADDYFGSGIPTGGR